MRQQGILQINNQLNNIDILASAVEVATRLAPIVINLDGIIMLEDADGESIYYDFYVDDNPVPVLTINKTIN